MIPTFLEHLLISEGSPPPRTRLQKARDIAVIRQKGRCFWCRRPMTPTSPTSQRPTDVTAEHIVTRSGGGGLQDNIVAACYECNNRRGDSDIVPESFPLHLRRSVSNSIANFVDGVIARALGNTNPKVRSGPGTASGEVPGHVHDLLSRQGKVKYRREKDNIDPT